MKLKAKFLPYYKQMGHILQRTLRKMAATGININPVQILKHLVKANRNHKYLAGRPLGNNLMNIPSTILAIRICSWFQEYISVDRLAHRDLYISALWEYLPSAW